MNSNIILITVLLLIVVTNIIIVVIIRKHPGSISGFSMAKDESDIQGKQQWRALLCRMIITGSTVTLAGGLTAVYYSNILLFSVSVSLPVLLGVMYAYSKRRRTGCSNPKSKKNYALIIIPTCIICILLAALGSVFYLSRSNLEISVTQTELKINGLYGTDILYRDIKEMNLQSRLPAIKLRSNGFAAGNTKLGNFITQDDERMMLFVHSDTCFIRIVARNGKTYYLNAQEPDETVKTFKRIKRHL